LKDLGVGVVGHRRKLLNAIAALRADANTKVPFLDTLPTIDRSPKDAAERRHLTVMICDLVGSTALSARLDPAIPSRTKTMPSEPSIASRASRGRPSRRRAAEKRDESFNHLVGAREHDRRNLEANRLRGPDVDHQRESGWPLNW
jgi:hypothetical protein